MSKKDKYFSRSRVPQINAGELLKKKSHRCQPKGLTRIIQSPFQQSPIQEKQTHPEEANKIKEQEQDRRIDMFINNLNLDEQQMRQIEDRTLKVNKRFKQLEQESLDSITKTYKAFLGCAERKKRYLKTEVKSCMKIFKEKIDPKLSFVKSVDQLYDNLKKSLGITVQKVKQEEKRSKNNC